MSEDTSEGFADQPRDEPMKPMWRVGRKLGRTIYRNDVCVGMVDTEALAHEIVNRMNEPHWCNECEGVGEHESWCSAAVRGGHDERDTHNERKRREAQALEDNVRRVQILGGHEVVIVRRPASIELDAQGPGQQLSASDARKLAQMLLAEADRLEERTR